MELPAMGKLPAAFAVALLAGTFGLGLTGCGEKETEDPAASVESQQTEDSATEDTAAEDSAAAEDDSSAPMGLTGEPLPADWPEEALVPNGEVILVLEMGGGGYKVVVSGVDDEQARGLIAEMAAAGLTTDGPTETGIGEEWTADVTTSTRMVSYAYAGGGAGLPEVAITLWPPTS